MKKYPRFQFHLRSFIRPDESSKHPGKWFYSFDHYCGATHVLGPIVLVVRD